ncbi:hypothetical protein D9M72_489390 [compost metagenome]
MQAHIGLAAEQAVALARGAGIDIEAAFQHEDALQAAAQVFGAAQAPARAGQVARVQAGGGALGTVAAGHVADDFEAGIGDAVQGYVRCGLGRCHPGCRRSGHCCRHCKESFLHCDFSVLW